MIADLHVHYPMRVLEDLTPTTTDDRLGELARRLRFGEKLEGLFIRSLGRFLSDRDPHAGYRVTVEGLRAGEVGVVLSALYRPLDEMDLSKGYAAPPDARYFDLLIRDLERVEAEVEGHRDPQLIRVVHDVGELDAARADAAIAVVHCVEGGFHLGDTPEHVAANVAELAARGVAYITVAHLFFRQIAATAPALPFLKTDAAYDVLFPQPPGIGLTGLGEAAVTAMVDNGVLVDLSHMRTDAVMETLDLLDRLDDARTIPVISSHAGFRFGDQDYMVSEPMLERICDRNGVVGLILAQHQLNDGLFEGHTTAFAETKAIIFRHVDRIAQVTGGYDHLAIGSDLDGFIRPTATGLESSADLPRLERALRERYDGEDVDKILSGNVLRVLRDGWGRRP
ncbi:MAG TPA: membrane dipeptidase [Baekduia sp.]|nr:membrane dipeptidase [Baekduia sp.]